MNIHKWLKKSSVSPIIATILITGILKSLKFDKEVELILDNCPPTFDFTEGGDKTVEEIDRSILVMEKINKVDKE